MENIILVAGIAIILIEVIVLDYDGIKRMFMRFLRHYNHDLWWKLHCNEMYCNNCSFKTDTCFIDYYTGKCVD